MSCTTLTCPTGDKNQIFFTMIASVSFRSLALITLLSSASHGAPFEDLVVSLPGFDEALPSPQFSGYLDASSGCDTETNGPLCQIHYWLALKEDSNRPWDAPLLLWLNGGPGGTSIMGMLQENGPLLINATGGLHRNPYAWTKVANLLVLESPIGVGYSYCSRQAEQNKPCVNNDIDTATATRAALVDFFTKFPELSDRPFYLTGESYAGVYIPTLAKELLDHAPQIQLKGIALADPCTDNTAQRESMDHLWYSHKNGLVDDDVFDTLWNQCGARLGNPLMDGNVRQKTAKELGLHVDPKCSLAFRKFIMSSSFALNHKWKNLYVDGYALFAPTSFQENNDMAAYMQRDDVRQALHVDDAPSMITWPTSGVGFNYTKQYDACNHFFDPDDAYNVSMTSMIDFHRYIAPRLDKTWIINGDADPCVSYEGTAVAIKRLGFSELDGGSYRPWFYHHSAASLKLLAEKAPRFGSNLLSHDIGVQMGGEVVDYEHGVAFATVHGSGHMVPQFRPQAALRIIQQLVASPTSFEEAVLLSPLMPVNKTLTEMSDDDFEKAMNEWTEKAKTYALNGKSNMFMGGLDQAFAAEE